MFWFAREAAMRWVFNPLGRKVGISKKRSLVRWSEQSWAMLFPVSLQVSLPGLDTLC